MKKEMKKFYPGYFVRLRVLDLGSEPDDCYDEIASSGYSDNDYVYSFESPDEAKAAIPAIKRKYFVEHDIKVIGYDIESHQAEYEFEMSGNVDDDYVAPPDWVLAEGRQIYGGKVKFPWFDKDLNIIGWGSVIEYEAESKMTEDERLEMVVRQANELLADLTNMYNDFGTCRNERFLLNGFNRILKFVELELVDKHK